MKPAPTKYSARNTTKNQNTAICYSEKQEIRRQAIEASKLFDTLPHLKIKPIKYLLKR